MARKTTGGRGSHRWRCRVALRFVSSLPKVNRQIVLLRGINLGPRRRVPIAELRNLPEAVARVRFAGQPAGVARSQLWARLSSERFFGVTGTARNRTTVTTLLAMADEH